MSRNDEVSEAHSSGLGVGSGQSHRAKSQVAGGAGAPGGVRPLVVVRDNDLVHLA